MALDSRWVPSGETRSPVTVSEWPLSCMATSILRRSHTLITFSMPPVYTCT